MVKCFLFNIFEKENVIALNEEPVQVCFTSSDGCCLTATTTGLIQAFQSCPSEGNCKLLHQFQCLNDNVYRFFFVLKIIALTATRKKEKEELP